jgi:hypothetical protein
MKVSGLLKLTLQNDNYTDNFPLERQIMIVYFTIGMNRKKLINLRVHTLKRCGFFNLPIPIRFALHEPDFAFGIGVLRKIILERDGLWKRRFYFYF